MGKTAPFRAEYAEPESMEQLLGDCARMVPHWTVPSGKSEERHPARPAVLHGVRVPVRSARLLDGMSEYGD
ncbi:hypothetical protein [Streptomyces sp. 891-h]|uniref:hypothetical protein n=1 Tax=unclassified Streptomyces TaxID=2593676 RepID=UPI001FAAFB52|nr:hypothetical protein [Streptomyces sp. 891-h]UNZ19716.1 hypothetical protein HC362_24420 [Streptomyces sp. 891-h]